MTDFKDFVKQFKRMCNTYNNECSKCPLNDHRGIYLCFHWCFEDPEKAEEIIMQWAKEHPPVTNRDKFKEVFECDPYMFDHICSKWLDEEYKEAKKENKPDGRI